MGALDDLIARVQGGGAQPQQSPLDALIASVGSQSPQPANQQEANGPDMPTAQNGRVIEMPTQQVQGDANPSLLDSLLRHASNGYDALNSRFGPSPDVRAAQNDQAARQFVGSMDDGAARRGAAYVAAPFAAAGPAGMALASGTAQYADDPDHPLQAARVGIANGMMGAAAGNFSKAIGSFANDAGAVADTARLRAPGMPANEVAAMTPEARAALAAKLEDPANGLTTGTFQGPSGYLKNAQALQARGLGGMQSAEGQIAGLPQQPSVPVGDIIDAQRAKAAAQSTLADPANAGPVAFRQKFADNLQGDTLRVAAPPMNDAQRFEALSKGYQPSAYHSNELPWQRAVEQRRNIDGFTSFGSSNAEESAQNAIRKEIGGGLRDGIDSSLSAPNVPPELASQWRGGRDQYALGSQVGDAAFKAIPNTGLPGSIGEIPRAIMRSGGQGALAAGARAVQGGLNNAADVAPAGAAGAALQQWLGSKGGTQQPANSQASSGTTGGVSGQRAEQALQVNPQLLGKWAPQFEEAQRNGGTEAINALITKLALNDTEFRTGPYQQLSQGQSNGP